MGALLGVENWFNLHFAKTEFNTRQNTINFIIYKLYANRNLCVVSTLIIPHSLFSLGFV